jgi:hypothetical protein
MPLWIVFYGVRLDEKKMMQLLSGTPSHHGNDVVSLRIEFPFSWHSALRGRSNHWILSF